MLKCLPQCREGFFELSETFVEMNEICSYVEDVVRLPYSSEFMIRFCGNDYLISWIFSVMIFIYSSLFDSLVLGEFLEGLSL
jgi:hypothetical protein